MTETEERVEVDDAGDETDTTQRIGGHVHLDRSPSPVPPLAPTSNPFHFDFPQVTARPPTVELDKYLRSDEEASSSSSAVDSLSQPPSRLLDAAGSDVNTSASRDSVPTSPPHLPADSDAPVDQPYGSVSSDDSLPLAMSAGPSEPAKNSKQVIDLPSALPVGRSRSSLGGTSTRGGAKALAGASRAIRPVGKAASASASGSTANGRSSTSKSIVARGKAKTQGVKRGRGSDSDFQITAASSATASARQPSTRQRRTSAGHVYTEPTETDFMESEPPSDDANPTPSRSAAKRDKREAMRPSIAGAAGTDIAMQSLPSPPSPPRRSVSVVSSGSTSDSSDTPLAEKARLAQHLGSPHRHLPSPDPTVSPSLSDMSEDEALVAHSLTLHVSSSSKPSSAVALPNPPHIPDSEFTLQSTNCMRPTLKDLTRCHACVTRKPGFVCLFQGVRSIPPSRVAASIGPRFFDYASQADEVQPDFPTEFNEPFGIKHAQMLKTVAAFHLLPTMRAEFAHTRLPNAIRVRHELGTRSTCDTCLQSILSGSWFCTLCARELCFDCFAEVGELVKQKRHEVPSGLDCLEQEKRLLKCHSGRIRSGWSRAHVTANFIPTTRFKAGEAEQLVRDMESHVERFGPPLERDGARNRVDSEQLNRYYGAVNARHMAPKEEGLPYLKLPALDFAPPLASVSQLDPLAASSRLPGSSTCTSTPLDTAPLESSTASDPDFAVRTAKRCTLDTFRSIWALGEPVVIDLSISDRSSLDWTPSYFIQKYGDQKCGIVSNTTGNEVQRTVGEFFQQFGKGEAALAGETRKIKDWPSSTSFKSEFPDLFADYQQLVPMGAITRLDGVLNIAAHTPPNDNPADLGPKGYFSQTSNDEAGGQGSTKLHTINYMPWSSDDADGRPGTAAWDLFRAEDAEQIRDFLYEYQAEQVSLESGVTVTADDVRNTIDDPIHTQQVYLDRELRARLLKEKGIKPFRIWQSPGQVVFIPAGCAHQVCNFADCIKIASDFVSLENVARCWKVTDEFRMQTKDKILWRSDVLQLKTQLLWAWKSACRLD